MRGTQLSVLVGPLVHRILTDQFQALRDGDRFWYQHHLPERLRAIVERQRLGDVIRRNTETGRELPRDIWRVGR